MAEPVLFRWPPNAAFGRTVPKTKFYEHGNVRTAMREKFVDDVQRITWAYKLADDTIRLRCRYDNTPARQPVVDGVPQAPRDVHWGEGTFDEMCINFFYATVP